MGRKFWELLDGTVYACKSCRTHLASKTWLVSKQFHSRTGRAYLFTTAANIVVGPHEERQMTTGMHIVCDAYCAECLACVGWQYICAYEKSQKYKEGKVILERALVVDFDKTSGMARSGSSGSPTSTEMSGSLEAGCGVTFNPGTGQMTHVEGMMMLVDESSDDDPEYCMAH